MTISEVSVSCLEDIAFIVNKGIHEGTSLLLLYDRPVENMLHRFLMGIVEDGSHFSVHFSGERMTTIDTFYDEVRSSVPMADYMASNLDAFIDILRVEAVSEESEKVTYWIWERSHILLQKDPDFYRTVYEILTSKSRELRARFADAHRNNIGLGTHLPLQRLVLIMTGKGDIMASDVSRPDSFFHRLPDMMATLYPDLSTQTVAYYLK